MFEVKKLGVAIGRRNILDHVDLIAEPAKFTAILGPNGSGKSTLLRALSGEIPYSGTVCLHGRELSAYRRRELARLRAVLPQSHFVGFPFLVHEVVAMGLEAGGQVPSPKRIREILDLVKLAGFENRNATQLSGGEQARMHLARILCQIGEPSDNGKARWLLLDEPVASLDIRHQMDVLKLARDFAAKGGGVIAVMHDLNLTAMFADRLILMKGGRIVREGANEKVMNSEFLSELYDWPLSVKRDPATGLVRISPSFA